MADINPKGHIVHAMSEYISREGLFYQGRKFTMDPDFPDDKLEGFFKGKKIKEYPEWIHCTEWIPLIGLSVHGYVMPDGSWVVGERTDPEKCHHAGKSEWKDLTGLNNHFLGFEVIVEGKNSYGQFIKKINTTNWVSDSVLVKCLEKSKEWMKEYGYGRDMVVRHSDVSGDSVRGEGKGKQDPGKMFPWELFKAMLSNNV